MNDIVSASGHSAKSPEDTNAAFDYFRHQQRGMVNMVIADDPGALVFHGNLDGDVIFDAYLSGFETEELRQEHNCRCCRQFFRRYGNVMVARPGDGDNWPAVPLFFHDVAGDEDVASVYRNPNVNLPLFPVILISELHGVRSVIEAFCHSGRLEDVDQGLAFWGYIDGKRQIVLTLPDNSVVNYEVVTR